MHIEEAKRRLDAAEQALLSAARAFQTIKDMFKVDGLTSVDVARLVLQSEGHCDRARGQLSKAVARLSAWGPLLRRGVGKVDTVR